MTTPARPQELTEPSVQLLADHANSYAVVRKVKPLPFVRDDVT